MFASLFDQILVSWLEICETMLSRWRTSRGSYSFRYCLFVLAFIFSKRSVRYKLRRAQSSHHRTNRMKFWPYWFASPVTIFLKLAKRKTDIHSTVVCPNGNALSMVYLLRYLLSPNSPTLLLPNCTHNQRRVVLVYRRLFILLLEVDYWPNATHGWF